MHVHTILESVSKGDIQCAYDNMIFLSNMALSLLDMSDEDIKNNGSLDVLVDIIKISNIIYNNTDRDILPIEDGVYDLLVTKLQRIDYSKFTPGAVPFIAVSENTKESINELIRPFIFMHNPEDQKRYAESEYKSILNTIPEIHVPRMVKPFYMMKNNNTTTVNKRLRNTSHGYPNLVGTLDKAKFVLTRQAEELGVADKPNVKIFERDFLELILRSGLININDPITMIATLKYDGVSIEADVTDHIIGARTRGDTDNDEASDLTEILEGYDFPNARGLNQKPIGIKFEAIILYEDLAELNTILGKSYINGRTAIIGVLGQSYAKLLRNYITLVPLQADTGIPMNRIDEINYLNTYYANRVLLRSYLFQEPYNQLLQSIKSYVEDAEFLRTWSRFMYDGVVLELIDPKLVNTLGRKNNINQYEMAIKFNPLKKSTIFLGYTYSVGQNGVITPNLHYQPIEFMGAIHTKCSGASYEKFCKLNLYEGDIVDITYTNDVMPYPTKPDNEHNRQNHKRPPRGSEIFPTVCPVCGESLEESSSGKIRYCPNMHCKGRCIPRLSSMLNRLGIKDFSESTVELLGGNVTFSGLMDSSVDDFAILGPTNCIKLYQQLQDLKAKRLPDYRIIGALGFTNIAAKTWKLIFRNISLKDLWYLAKQCKLSGDDVVVTDVNSKQWWCLRDMLANIKGVGPVTADTIVLELGFFWGDIDYIVRHDIYTPTIIGNSEDSVVIRFSGYRDYEVAEVLNSIEGVDCDPDGSITKKTTLLLIPYVGYTSSKTAKAEQYGIPIITATDFMDAPGKYIPGLESIGKF